MIVLYSDPKCTFSHIVRIVLCEKEMDYKIVDVNINNKKDLSLISQHHHTPVLIDDIDKNNKKKDLIITDTTIACEYIDERFPHPQLMPIEPSEKARMKMILHKLNQEAFVHVRFIEDNFNNIKLKKELDNAKKAIAMVITELSGTIQENKKTDFILSKNFSLIDAMVLPVLWRLSYFEIKEKPTWGPILKYAEKQFSRKSFSESLTPIERNLKR